MVQLTVCMFMRINNFNNKKKMCYKKSKNLKAEHQKTNFTVVQT